MAIGENIVPRRVSSADVHKIEALGLQEHEFGYELRTYLKNELSANI